MKTLKPLETHKDVKKLSDALTDYFNVQLYRPTTQTYTIELGYYVLRFQIKHNLEPDAIVGKKTWNKLLSVVNHKEDTLIDPPLPDSASMLRFYGNPSDMEDRLVRLDFPYPMRLAWDMDIVVKSSRVHPKAKPAFERAFSMILSHYGFVRIRKLHLDAFGGIYNKRRMRGGSRWSTHSYGCAIDLDPQNNPFRGGWKDAGFARPEYATFLEIMKECKFRHLSKYDAMHFQYTK